MSARCTCKWIFDRNAGDDLTRVQVLGENSDRSSLGCGRYNEGIPESDFGFVFNSKRRRDFSWSRFNATDGVAVYHKPGYILGQRDPNLPRDVDVEFLQDLYAQNACSLPPEVAENAVGHFMLCTGVEIVSVNQNLRIRTS